MNCLLVNNYETSDQIVSLQTEKFLKENFNYDNKMQSICNNNYNMSVSRDPFFVCVFFHSNIIIVSSMALEENIALSFLH